MTKRDIRAIVDALGQLRAREKDLRDALAELGPGDYEGDVFKATVRVSTQHRLDMAAAKEKLGMRWVKAHTTETTCTTVSTKVRNAALAEMELEAA